MRRAASPEALAPRVTFPRLLFGRSRESRRLETLLTDDDSGVVTVTGPGGVGKSALAMTVGRSLDAAFDDCLLVGEQSELGELARALLSTPDGTGGPVRDDMLPPSRCGRRVRRRLLIVDPADDLAAAIGELSVSLPPGSQILACAIRPLGVPNERTLPLAPLPTIDPDADPEVIEANPGVQLFRSAAPDPSLDEHPSPDDLRAIATLCRQLGGWPLALQHAATLTHLLTPQALSDLFADRPELAFEPAASPADPTRLLPSLRAAFDRTWRRMTAAERELLRAATMFSGPFRVPQIAAVAARPIAATLRTLTRLLDLYLVYRAPGQDDRFVITPLVRQYARWTFGRRAPERPVRQRYIEVVRDTAHASAVAYDGGDEMAAMRAIGDVDAELVPTLDHLVACGATADALQLAADVAPGLVQSGAFDIVTERLDALLRRDDVGSGPALARALVGYADIVFTGIDGTDRHELAAARLQQGVQLLRQGSDAHALMRALSVMIRAWPVMRDPRMVAASVREGESIAREIGSPAWLARFEAWSGMLAHQIGDVGSAIALGSSALARGRRCGDLRARLLGGLLLHTVPESPSKIPGGLPGLQNLVRLAEELHEPRLGSIVLAYRAQSSLQAGRPAEASYWSARALETGGGLDTPFGAGFAIMFLVGVARVRGETAQAVTLHGMVAHRLDELAAELPPRMATEYTALVAELRASLGASRFDLHARAGAQLAWHDATAAALTYAYRASDPGGEPGGPGSPPAPGPGAPATAGSTNTGSELPRPATPSPATPECDALTPREHQVLDLIAEGLDTRVIAERLRVSVNAVSHHTSNILSKLGVQNRTQAAIWAVHRHYALAP